MKLTIKLTYIVLMECTHRSALFYVEVYTPFKLTFFPYSGSVDTSQVHLLEETLTGVPGESRIHLTQSHWKCSHMSQARLESRQ